MLFPTVSYGTLQCLRLAAKLYHVWIWGYSTPAAAPLFALGSRGSAVAVFIGKVTEIYLFATIRSVASVRSLFGLYLDRVNCCCVVRVPTGDGVVKACLPTVQCTKYRV